MIRVYMLPFWKTMIIILTFYCMIFDHLKTSLYTMPILKCLTEEVWYLVERLCPHSLQVGWGVFIYVYRGAVLQRLPLRQMIVGLHCSNFPEIFLCLSRLAILPLFGVQSLQILRKA